MIKFSLVKWFLLHNFVVKSWFLNRMTLAFISILSNYVNIPSVENISSIRTVGSGAGIDASPAVYSSSAQQRTPLSYELTSPASNSSSYLNKTNNSIDNHGTNSQLPEVCTRLLISILFFSFLNTKVTEKGFQKLSLVTFILNNKQRAP